MAHSCASRHRNERRRPLVRGGPASLPREGATSLSRPDEGYPRHLLHHRGARSTMRLYSRRQWSLNLNAVPAADASHQAAGEMQAGEAARRRIVVVGEETIDQLSNVRFRSQDLDQMRPQGLKLD